MTLMKPMHLFDGKPGPETDADLIELIETSDEPFVFEGMSFNGLDFELAELDGASFRGSDARGVNFQSIEAQRANFDDTQLVKSNMIGANLRDASFRRANLVWVNMAQADLRGASFTGATFDTFVKNARFSAASDFSGAIGRVEVGEGIFVDDQKLNRDEALRWFAARINPAEQKAA